MFCVFIIVLMVLAQRILALEVDKSSSEKEDLRVAVFSYDVPGEQEYFDRLAKDSSDATGLKIRIDFDVWDGAHDKIKNWIATGTGPDLVVVPDIWLVEFAHGIAPCEDKQMKRQFQNSFFPSLHIKGILRGKLMGPVWATSTKALFYRKDLFKKAGLKPPKTWDDMLKAAIKLHDPPNVYGLGLPGKREYETDDNFYFFFWSAGGLLFDEQGKSYINCEAGVKALQFYVDLINKYHVTQPEVTSWNRKECRRLFEAGRLAMFATGPWAIESLRKNTPDIEFAVVPLPIDQRSATLTITDHMVVMRHSPHKKAAKQFLSFAYQDKYRLAYARLGLVPEKIKVAQDDYFQKDPAWKVFVDIIPDGRRIPLMNWEKIGIATRQAMYQAITGRKPVKETLDDLAVQINKITAENRTLRKKQKK